MVGLQTQNENLIKFGQHFQFPTFLPSPYICFNQYQLNKMHRQNSPDPTPPQNTNSTLKKHQEDFKISTAQLHDLANNDYKFQNKIKQLNKIGADLINQQKESEAVAYLLEAQTVLQYAASCGKTIDRVLITTTLQNEACAYQRMWDLQKSSDYMEAIIYNIQSSLDIVGIQFDITVKNEESQCYKDLSSFVQRRNQALSYYLQFSAVNSQINRHTYAFESAKKALRILQIVCSQSLKYEKIKKSKNSILMEDLMASFNFEAQTAREIFTSTKEALSAIEKHRQFFSFDVELIQNFVIGEVMQIGTITIDEAIKTHKIQEEITHLSIIYKALYLSICYFVMGTELRLISKQKHESQLRKAVSQLNKSKMYHLYAIKIAATLVPCDSKYLQHLIKSFKNHYEIDLYGDDLMTEEFSRTSYSSSLDDYDDFNLKKEISKLDKYNETKELISENTKIKASGSFEFLKLSREKVEMKNKNKYRKSPIANKKKKGHKKDQPSKGKIKIFDEKTYIFPTKKDVKERSKEKLEAKILRDQQKTISQSRQRLAVNPEKVSRVRKVKQEYFMNDMKSNKKKKRQRKNSSNESSQPKRTMNSREKALKNKK